MNSRSFCLACAVSMIILPPLSAQAKPQRDESVSSAVDANRPAMLELLKDIVNIDSGSGDITGGNQIESILAARLSQIGAKVRYEPAEAPALPPNLVATFEGTGKGRILILAHIDTVFSAGTVAKRPFTTDGDRAYGPGVSDEKAGVVSAITALKIMHDLKFTNFAKITLLLDTSEELGSPGSTELIKAMAKGSDIAFNMEPGDPPDALTVWRKGAGDIIIQVTGRAAHAGVAPQNGRNAAEELVHQLSALNGKFPKEGDGITLNLTLLKASDRSNVIPDAAEADFDLRVRKPEQFGAVLNEVKSALIPTVVPDTKVTAKLGSSMYPPLIEGPRIESLGKRAQEIYAELGKSLGLTGDGGGSESAVAASTGTPTLDGLGPLGGDFHTDHEWLDLSSLSPRLYLLTRLLMEMARGSK